MVLINNINQSKSNESAFVFSTVYPNVSESFIKLFLNRISNSFNSCISKLFRNIFYFLDDVNVTIDGPARTDVKRVNAGDRATFSYLPMTPGAYNININYKGKAIKGSPFQAKVSGTRHHPLYGHCCCLNGINSSPVLCMQIVILSS